MSTGGFVQAARSPSIDDIHSCLSANNTHTFIHLSHSVLLFGPSEHPLAPLRPAERTRRKLADQSLLAVAHILRGYFKCNFSQRFQI